MDLVARYYPAVLTVMALLALLSVIGCMLYESQRDSEVTVSMRKLSLHVAFADRPRSISLPVMSVYDAQQLLNSWNYSLIASAYVKDRTNNDVVVRMNDNGVFE